MSIESTQPTAPIGNLAGGQELRTRGTTQENSVATGEARGNKTEVTLSALTKKFRPMTTVTWIMHGWIKSVPQWPPGNSLSSQRKLLRRWCDIFLSINNGRIF